MTDGKDLGVPEHVVQLRHYVEQAEGQARADAAWLLAQALASHLVNSRCTGEQAEVLANEGLSSLPEGHFDDSPDFPESLALVESVLRWRQQTGAGDRVAAATTRAHLVLQLAARVPGQVRQLSEQVSEFLANDKPGSSNDAGPVATEARPSPHGAAVGADTSWVTAMFGGQLGSNDVVLGDEQPRALVEAAGRLPKSDPQRARWLLQAAQHQQARALGRRRWTREEDERLEQALQAASEVTADLGPDWMTFADRFSVLVARATPHMADMQAIRGEVPDGKTRRELGELADEADQLLAECDATAATSPGPFSPGALAGLGALVHLMRARSMWLIDATAGVERAVARAELHLQRLPAATAQQLRAMVPLLRYRPDEAPPAGMQGTTDMVVSLASEQFKALGGDFPRVLRLARQALQSGQPAQLAAAIDAVIEFLADLGAGHPGTAQMLGVLCELRTNHAVATSSPKDIPTAIDAGIKAAQTAPTAGPEAGGSDLQTVGSLVNALIAALAMDQRSGPYAQAAQVLDQALDHKDLSRQSTDGWLHLEVSLGAGVADLMHWRSTGDQEARNRGQARLAKTQKAILERRVATIDWVRRTFQLLQVHATAIASWGDTTAAKPALQAMAALEEILDEHPSLAAQAQQILSGMGPTTGPAATRATDLRQALRMMRGLFEMMGATPPGRATEGLLTDHALRQILSGNTSPDMTSILDQAMRGMGIDPQLMQAMTHQVMADPDMRRHLEAMLGPQPGILDQIAHVSDLLPSTPPRSATSTDDDAMPNPGDAGAATTAVANEFRFPPDDEKATRAELREIESVLATHRQRTPRIERVRLLDARATLQRRLGAADPQLGRRAVYGARVALRELAQLVIAEPRFSERLKIAAQAAPIAERAVEWAIEDGDLETAVGIAENGRALSLAAVLLHPSLLDLAGGDRSRSLGELLSDVSATMDGQITLLSPPLQNVEVALLNTDLDALVYLIPPSESGATEPTGHALLLRKAYDGITLVELPDATDDPSVVLTDPHEAMRQHLTALDRGTSEQRLQTRQAWDGALDAQGAWCHRVILGPVLDRVETWRLNRPPHLGLVPLGRWASVPFAAASWPDPDIPELRHYAIQDAVLSTIPSARVLMRAAATTGMPIDEDVLVVVNPCDRSNPHASRSSFPFARAFGRAATTPFPDATVLQSRSGAGTSARILQALGQGADAGASLLHLTTHGCLEPEIAVQVADGWLPLTRIVEAAADADPDRPGGTVVMNACLTDAMRADEGIPDEALTLATGMLAAGAKHVIGTRWPVPEGPGAVLGYHLLQHLSRGLSPSRALHAAQLDMIDGIPGPGVLAHESSAELAAPRVWAAYTHQGA